MDKPPPAAATKQSCLQRLQYLQTHFQNIGSPAELADAEREGGHILAQLLHGKHIEPDTLIPNSRDLLLDYAVGALDWQPMNNGLAEQYQLSLWTFLAMGCSEQPRVVLHDAGPAPAWTYSITNGEHKYEHRWPADVRLKTTDRAKDFRQQGKRYALFTSELLTRIQAAPPLPEQEQGNTGKPKRTRGPGTEELEPIVAKILATKGEQRGLTAVDVSRIAEEAGQKTSASSVKKTRAWRYYAERIGTSRQKNRPEVFSSDKLEEMADETKTIKQPRRKARPIEPEE
jgi:hypothetical protein